MPRKCTCADSLEMMSSPFDWRATKAMSRQHAAMRVVALLLPALVEAYVPSASLPVCSRAK